MAKTLWEVKVQEKQSGRAKRVFTRRFIVLASDHDEALKEVMTDCKSIMDDDRFEVTPLEGSVFALMTTMEKV